ncbi:hypothetical protein BW892_25965 [Bacillus cereus]|uniref:Uncharacterized protein n=1 Tax=Bacillus cereus TaxID=1396 RepID=A0A1S9U9M8_BACCE|nr:hypothetical protein BW892_25965 [Bacillus cereus]
MWSPFVGKCVIAGSVDAGLGFTIDTKVTVNGSSQYKIHNSKEKAKRQESGTIPDPCPRSCPMK